LRFLPLLCLTLVAVAFPPAVGAGADGRTAPDLCTYEVQVWNVNLRSSSSLRSVRHAYDAVSPGETDAATGCTVCSEDQVEVLVPPMPAVSVCYRLAPQVRTALERLTKTGAVVDILNGYRVILSRGPLDADGNRTEFSNHSFGTAVDVNPDRNGLYDHCSAFGPRCRLLRGGAWQPEAPGTLTRDSDTVRSFKAAGFRWGGEIEGKQKDFMHFSLTGY
jgi:hypothetical protein